MGNSPFLQQPITDKKKTFHQTDKFRVSICQMQGWRRYMQDAYIAYPQVPGFEDIALFGVFDGHGGPQSAKYVAQHFLECFVKRPALKQGKIGDALTETFIHVQLMMKMKPAVKELIQFKKQVTKMSNISQQDLQSGCTAIVVAITKDKIICANAGDSRAALCRKFSVEALSEDHKPENPIERLRIENAGVQIIQGRVNGLNLTRSIGDFGHKSAPGLPFHKQAITCIPDIKQVSRIQGDYFLLIGCDGIWQKSGDDFTQIPLFMKQQLQKKQQAHIGDQRKALEVLQDFLDVNLNPGDMNPFGRDNMTALLIQFKKQVHITQNPN